MNVLCLGPRVIGPELAMEIISAFLSAHFIGNDPGQEDMHGGLPKSGSWKVMGSNMTIQKLYSLRTIALVR